MKPLKLPHSSDVPFLTRLSSPYNSVRSLSLLSSNNESKPFCNIDVRCSASNSFSTL